jgi:uncharacterized protein YukE
MPSTTLAIILKVLYTTIQIVVELWNSEAGQEFQRWYKANFSNRNT